MSNRIANYLPASNRIATVFAPAVMRSCGSFVALPMGQRSFNPTFGTTTNASIYEIALQAARVQVAAKRRFRASTSTKVLWN